MRLKSMLDRNAVRISARVCCSVIRRSGRQEQLAGVAHPAVLGVTVDAGKPGRHWGSRS